MTRPVVLNVNVYDFGTDAGAWRAHGGDGRDNLRADFWRHAGRTAERGGFDGVFLADNPGVGEDPALRPSRMVEPLTTLATVLDATERLGAIATVSTSTNDPVSLARRLLTAHAHSGGRFGWNVVTGVSGTAAEDFGYARPPGREERYARATEFLTVFSAYLDAVRDGAAFRHTGEHFAYDLGPQVDGVLAAAAADGGPLIVQAGGSDQGRELAAATADVVFSAEMRLDTAVANRTDLRERAARLGRRPPVVLPGIHLVLGASDEEAERRYRRIHALSPDGYVLGRFAGLMGVDPADIDLDADAGTELARLPVDASSSSLGFQRSVIRYAEANPMPVHALLREYSGFGHQFLVGGPERVADVVDAWVTAGAADGFNVLVDANPSGLDDVVEHLVPVLRRRGVVAAEPDTTPFVRRLREARR